MQNLCNRCGNPNGKRVKKAYCDSCRKIVFKENRDRWWAKHRAIKSQVPKHIFIESEDSNCDECHKFFIKYLNTRVQTNLCESCRNKKYFENKQKLMNIPEVIEPFEDILSFPCDSCGGVLVPGDSNICQECLKKSKFNYLI